MYSPSRWDRFLDWLYRDEKLKEEIAWIAAVNDLAVRKVNRRILSDKYTLSEHHRRGIKV